MAHHAKLVQSPGLARFVLRLSSSGELCESMLGDLEEEFAERARTDIAAARAWYLAQALNSAAPLMQQRVNRSAAISSMLVFVLTSLAFVVVNAWEVDVARVLARTIARSFQTAPPLPYARLAYVGAQMLIVGAAALVIATLTFDVENSVYRNATSRLGMLALVVVAPQFIAMAGPRAYPLDFVLPWAFAMMIAIVGGAALATRIVAKR